MQLVFHATFEGRSLDRSVWATCFPWVRRPRAGCTNFGNSDERAWFMPADDTVSGGVLHLVADEHPTKGTTSSGAPETYAYSSGMVTTYKSFSFTYGFVDVVAHIPGTTGSWPALWLLPRNMAWPPEIDIMENWGTSDGFRTTFHWSAAGRSRMTSSYVRTRSDLAGGWHSYGLLWKPGSLTWYLDGRVVVTYTGANVPSHPMYFLADLGIKGPASSHSSFGIRSVRIYQSRHR